MRVIALLCLAFIVTGCGKDYERSLILIDPISGCQYIGTTYGSNPIISGSYIKPRTDANGKHVCAQRPIES